MYINITVLMLFAFCYHSTKAMEYMPGTGTYISHKKRPVKITTTSTITGVEVPPGMEPSTVTYSGNTITIKQPTPQLQSSVCVFPPPAPVIINNAQPGNFLPAQTSVVIPTPPIAAPLPVTPVATPLAVQPVTQPFHPSFPLEMTDRPASMPLSQSTTNSILPSSNEIYRSVAQLPTQCIQFIHAHPYITTGVSLAVLSYSYLLYRCWCIKKYLAQQTTWSAWKIQIPLHVLKEGAQEEIGDALMADIKNHYQVATGGYQLVQALLTFNDDLDAELKKLNTYKALVNFIDVDYLRIVLPDLHSLKIGLADHIDRILYLKDILYIWMHTNNRSLIGLSSIS